MPVHIGIVLFPNVTQLDATGPFEVLSRVPGAHVRMLAHTTETIVSDTGLRIIPDTTFEEAGPLDVVCVPGGPGQTEQMEDAELLGFLRAQARHARYLTSVCTGSMLLGAAGLLKGYRATSHWSCVQDLALFGAYPVDERVVHDRDRITGGGVTAGIDFGLVLAAQLAGKKVARGIQLGLEYNPAPPFHTGSASSAPLYLKTIVRALNRKNWQRRHNMNVHVARNIKDTLV